MKSAFKGTNVHHEEGERENTRPTASKPSDHRVASLNKQRWVELFVFPLLLSQSLYSACFMVDTTSDTDVGLSALTSCEHGNYYDSEGGSQTSTATKSDQKEL